MPAPFRSGADLFDENDRGMGEMLLSGQIAAVQDGINVSGQLLRCEARLEMGEMVASVQVPSRMAVLQTGADRILMAREGGFGTRKGNEYWAAGMSWVRAADQGSEGQILEIRSLELDRASASRVTMRASGCAETSS